MPLTADQYAMLRPEEQVALKMAATMVAADRNPGLNVTAELVLTIERLLSVQGTSAGTRLIAAERARQVNAEGYTPEHDARHQHYELARAGAVYALDTVLSLGNGHYTAFWPPGWEFKPGTPIQTLSKGGALVAAEIDRRIAAGEQP